MRCWGSTPAFSWPPSNRSISIAGCRLTSVKACTCAGPTAWTVDASVRVAKGATLGVGVQLFGQTVIEAGAVVEGPSVLIDSVVRKGARVLPFSHLQNAVVGMAAGVGPFARLRPGAQLGAEAKVGNFVELKNTRLGKGAKAGHLAYLGDATIGAGANIGAGTITCNYDGINKHPTQVGAGVFVGSNSTLIAPVALGKGAYVAAGSTINQSVAAAGLAVGRARQVTKKGYADRLWRRLRAQRSSSTKGRR